MYNRFCRDFDCLFWNQQNEMIERLNDGLKLIMLENAALQDKIRLLEDKIKLQNQIIEFQADYIEKGEKIDYTREF